MREYLEGRRRKEEGGKGAEPGCLVRDGGGEGYDLRGRTKRFALAIIRMVGDLPRSTAAQVLGRQVLRSGTSVGANYCEAYRGRSRAEFIAKAGDCLREIEETSYWLELLADSGIASTDQLAPLRKESDELTAIFVAILRRAKENLKEEVGRKKAEG
jgi:four helix bundle protein